MVIDVYCGKCNTKIGSTNILKPIKQISGVEDGKCPSCGHKVSLSNFTLDVVKSTSKYDSLE